jgi:hypothetical protein
MQELFFLSLDLTIINSHIVFKSYGGNMTHLETFVALAEKNVIMGVK